MSARSVPPAAISTPVVAAVAVAWIAARWWVAPQGFFPLSYVIPLLLCVWSRRYWQLWTMTAVFALSTSLRFFWYLPQHGIDIGALWTTYVATLFNLSVGSGVIYFVLRLRDRLDAEAEQVERQNQELAAQSEELSQQNEEIRAQAEELTEQTGELESQTEELERQNQELSEANERLSNREDVLHAAVECTRVAGGAQAALEAVCQRTLTIVGAPAVSLALLEVVGNTLKVRVGVELDDHPAIPREWPVRDSVARVVLEQDQTAYVDDLPHRPDLAAPFLHGQPYRSVLATPIRLAGRPAGLLVVCSVPPNHWTQEQFRVLEWAAAQAAPLLDSLRWQLALEQRAQAVEQANQAKDQFLATLSHELRTPLTPVLAAAGALEMDGRLPDDARAELAMIRRNVAIQSRLIDDLLDLTRISRGKLDLIQQELEVVPLLREAATIVAADLDAKDQLLVQEIDVPVGRKIQGDGARLQQVFWNLLKNAVKFSPRGSRLRLEARILPGHPRKSQPDVERVVVRVADDGVGIDPADLERIFQPFEQAASARRRGGNVGLGLGLSIAKAIVELHDGRLLASSDGPGRGSVFMVELPLLGGARHEATVVQVPEPPAAAAGTEASAGRILLVEDHGDTGRVMARLLRRAGYTVVHAETVGAALDAWAAGSFDLVVSDLGLPDGSGLDLMRQLREQDARVPGICMSGFGMESDVQASQEAGFVEHLIKPVDMQRLHAAIRRLLSTVTAGGDR